MLEREIVDSLAIMRNDMEINQRLGEINDTAYTNIFSFLRGNLIEWLPFGLQDDVLIVGRDYGALAYAIADKVNSVTCVDWSEESCYVSNIRKKDNVSVYLKNFDDFVDILAGNKFHYIIYAEPVLLENHVEISKSKIIYLFKILKDYLTEYGRLLFYSGNALGIKYWSGVKDEVTGGFFTGIENYSSNETLCMPTLYEIDKIIELLDFKFYKRYYPYPDYKFPTSIYSDDFLPEQGELTKNAFSWEDRVILFNEMAAFDSVIKNNQFKFMSNAYLVIFSNHEILDLNYFTKYSNDRSNDFSIRTDIKKGENDSICICKIGCTEEGTNHVRNMKKWHAKLSEIYSDIDINMCTDIKGGLEFQYVKGNSLLSILYNYLQIDDYYNFEKTILTFVNILKQQQLDEFEISPEFIYVFGEVNLPNGLQAGKVSNIDLIFSNILCDKDTWHMIDYEWVFDFSIPINYILYRSIYFFFHGPREKYNFNVYYQTKILEKLEIDEVQWNEYEKMEKHFQKFVCGSKVPLRTMGTKRPYRFGRDKIKCFFDYGKGFNSRNSCVIFPATKGNQYGHVLIGITEKMKRVRLDPCESECILEVKHIISKGTDIKEISYSVMNGMDMGDNIFFCASKDPQIIIELQDRIMQLECEFEVHELSEKASNLLAVRIKQGEE